MAQNSKPGPAKDNGQPRKETQEDVTPSEAKQHAGFAERLFFSSLASGLRTGKMTTVLNGKIVSEAKARRIVAHARDMGWLPPEDVAQTSKPAATSSNESRHNETTPKSSTVWPEGVKNVTAERLGETVTIIGARKPGSAAQVGHSVETRAGSPELLESPTRAKSISIKKKVLGSETKTRTAWVVEYYDQAEKRRRKTFKSRSDAEKFAETTRVLIEAFLDDDGFEYTIHQETWPDVPKPLTVGSIISRIGEVWRTNTRLSDAEQAFLTAFAAAVDRDQFIENNFFDDAVNEGKTIEEYTYRDMPDGENEEDAGWVGLHQFFGMYVVNATQYGEGEDKFGPFANRKDAKDAFDRIVSLYTT